MLLSIASYFVVVEGASDEPYMAFRKSDAIVQVGVALVFIAILAADRAFRAAAARFDVPRLKGPSATLVGSRLNDRLLSADSGHAPSVAPCNCRSGAMARGCG